MKKIITLLLVTFTNLMIAQSTGVDQVFLNSQTTITGCNTIDFGTVTNNNMTFYYTLTNAGQPSGTLFVKFKYSNSTNATNLTQQNIQSTNWSNGTAQSTIACSLSASEIQVTGSTIYLEFVSNSGVITTGTCIFQLTKTPVPTFTLSPTTASIACGDMSSRTFTVTPANIPSGANVTYDWSHPGWDFVGSTANSYTLKPSSATALPSSVVVTPRINGIAKPYLSCTVARATFGVDSMSIMGEDYVCANGIYSINNLPSNISIQSVTSSNPNVATVSTVVNNQFTVTKVSDGSITLSVVLRNECLQTATRTKQIQVGIPKSVNNAVLSGSSSICGTQYYTYTLSGASHPCISNIEWSVSDNLYIASETPTSVTVYRNSFDTQHAGVIIATVSGTNIEIRKGVWVGVPNTSGLTIQKIGSYDLFAGTWTKLKASYVPITYEANDPLNITFEWQIVNSMIRNYTDTAYKDVKPNTSGLLNIGVRVICECGFGEWKYQPFTVGGNGPLVPIPAKGL